MSKNKDSDAGQRKRTRDVIEETFARYEPKEEVPQIPNIGEPPRGVPSREKEQESLMTSYQMVTTGIAGIDTALGGGIADHSLILICGETGSNHGVFTQQILYNHSMENGKTAYYLAETLSIDIQENMEQFNWNLKDFLNRGIWKFVDMRTPDLQQLADLSPKALSDKSSIKLTPGLNSLKTDILTKIKEKHWTAIDLNHLLFNYDLKEIISLLLYIRAAIRIHGGIHFILLPTGIHSENQVNALKNVVDGVIEFRLREGPHEFENNLTIRKMKRLLNPLVLPFTTSETGIVIDTAARIT